MSCTVEEFRQWLAAMPNDATISDAHGQLTVTSADRTMALGWCNVTHHRFVTDSYRLKPTLAQQFRGLVLHSSWPWRDAVAAMLETGEVVSLTDANRASRQLAKVHFADGSTATMDCDNQWVTG